MDQVSQFRGIREGERVISIYCNRKSWKKVDEWVRIFWVYMLEILSSSIDAATHKKVGLSKKLLMEK